MSNNISLKASAEAEDRDEAPILDKHFFATGALRSGEVTLRPATDTMARRGRPPQGKAAKIQQSLRLSPEVLDHFRSAGKGWQARIDEVLRHVAELERAIALAGKLPGRTPGERKVQEDVKRFNDLILNRRPTPGEGIDARFAEAIDRISRATAAMLRIPEMPASGTPEAKPAASGNSKAMRPSRVDRSPKARAIVLDPTGQYPGTRRIGKKPKGADEKR